MRGERMKKQKARFKKPGKFLSLLCLAALLCLAVSYAFASYYHQSRTEANQLTASYVSCAISESLENGTGTETTTYKTSVTVTNTGNVFAYIRVRLVSYWQDENGNVVGRTSVTPTAADDTTDTTFVLNSEDWICVTDSDGTEYYYYTDPVSAGAGTSDLLASGSYITLVTEDDGYYIQVVEVLAEAVQAEPADAVTDAWGSHVTVGTDGVLTAK